MSIFQLLQIASAFAEPSKLQGNGYSQANTRLKRMVPGALATFHDALDDLEAELASVPILPDTE